MGGSLVPRDGISPSTIRDWGHLTLSELVEGHLALDDRSIEADLEALVLIARTGHREASLCLKPRNAEVCSMFCDRLVDLVGQRQTA